MNPLPTEYGPLVRELLRQAGARRQPANGTFELTTRCNLACRMCYVRHSAGDCAIREKELQASDWLGLAREAAKNGMVFLLLTGGEVFLRPDFFDIYEPLTRMGLILTLFTNGTLITAAIAERLAQSPPSRTEITLYGATAATYESITGVPDSYARCCRGIEELTKRRVPLGLKATLTRKNVHELEAMQQMAHNWGVPFSAYGLLSRRRDGGPSEVENCRLSPSESVTLDVTHNAFPYASNVPLKQEAIPANGANFYCEAGKSAFVVSPAGEMNVCLDLAAPAAQPLEVGFPSAWKAVQQFVDLTPPAAQVCRNCDARVFCPRCPAWSSLETGTLTDPVPYLCEIAHERKAHF